MGFFSRNRTALGMSVAALGGGLLFQACVGDEPATTTNGTDGGDVSDGTSGSDGGADASADDGGGDGAVATTYAPSLADSTRWEKVDIASLANGGFLGGAFDGRYVYFVPSKHATVVRYDTQAPFGNVTSWDGYDLSSLAVTMGGAVFVAPYIYLIPEGGSNSGTLVRFDTRSDFKSMASYSTFDMNKANVNDHQFSPGAFDGKYLYFGPLANTMAVKYDTTAAFDAGASYQSVALAPSAAYYSSTCFDGTNIYFVPEATSAGLGIGALRQYKTSSSFTSGGSFATFDTADGGLDPKAAGFEGCVFDGRYLYLEPYGINGGAGQGFASLVVRYDTTQSFTNLDSYSKFDLSGVDANAKGFHGTTFDGRYLYFAPFTKTTAVRFDTTGTFGNKADWQSYDLTTDLTPAATGFAGAVFDGEYVYFVPYNTTLAVRFHAKTPPSLPSRQGSFY